MFKNNGKKNYKIPYTFKKEDKTYPDLKLSSQREEL